MIAWLGRFGSQILLVSDASVAAEHWWTHEGHALVVVVGAPAPRVAAARRALNTLASGLDTRLARLEAVMSRLEQGMQEKSGAIVYRMEDRRPDAASS